MARVQQRTGDGSPEGSDFRPYFFRRDATDILREAFDELLTPNPTTRAGSQRTNDGEFEIIREQRLTLFEHDPWMQQLFHGDFDAFSAALDDPWLLDERLRSETPTAVSAVPRAQWNDLRSPAREWEDRQHGHAGSASMSDVDPVYDHAFQWACRVERWGHRVRATKKTSDHDLLRVLVNVTLVPAKVAFGCSAQADDDLAGFDLAAIGYRQAGIFCSRVLASLGSCYGRQVGRTQTVHDLLDEGREVLADIESRIAEIESEIRFRRGSA